MLLLPGWKQFLFPVRRSQSQNRSTPVGLPPI
jgi:hypothetical protein